MIRFSILLLCILMLASAGFAQLAKPETTPTADAPKLVSFALDDEKVSKATDDIVKQAGVRILLEKTAEVKITANVKEVPVEEALSVICKAGDLVWRQIFIRADSPMLKNPETLAATLRMMEGLKFPDMIIQKTSGDENLIHVAKKSAVDAVPTTLRKDMGMVAIYLITNDKAAKKALDKANTNAEKYAKLQKEAMDLFMKMTPEEREQAMASGMQLMQQMDPNYMNLSMQALMKNPDVYQGIIQSSMDNMFKMPVENRRAMIRMQIQAMQMITPEQQKLMQEDAMEVMKELGMGPGQQPPQ